MSEDAPPPPTAEQMAAVDFAVRCARGHALLELWYGGDTDAFLRDPGRLPAEGRAAVEHFLGVAATEEPEALAAHLRECPEKLRPLVLDGVAWRLVNGGDSGGPVRVPGRLLGRERSDPRFVAVADGWGEAVKDPVARLRRAVRDCGFRRRHGWEATLGVRATLLDRLCRRFGDQPETLDATLEVARTSRLSDRELRRRLLETPKPPPLPPDPARRLNEAVERNRQEEQRLRGLADRLDERHATAAAQEVRAAARLTREARDRLERAQGKRAPPPFPVVRAVARVAPLLFLAFLVGACTGASPAEVCNDLDDDGDGQVDEGVTGTWYPDADGDGYGDSDGAIEACEPPDGAVEEGTDCDDTDPDTHPGAEESCTEAVDRNCDGSMLFEDGDGDGAPACEDCDDTDAARSPLLEEVCNGVDDDCDGESDESGDPVSWYVDEDGDGYGVEVESCAPPEGTLVAEGGDCDDADPALSPGAEDVCDDGIDQDCDGYEAWCVLEGVLELGGAPTKLVGEAAGDAFGQPWPADFDGDGQVDLAVGARGSDRGGEGCGAVFFFNGPIQGTVYAEDADHVWEGDCWKGDSSYSPWYPSDAWFGDLDGDGTTDGVMGQRYRVVVHTGPVTDSNSPSDARLVIENDDWLTPLQPISSGGDLDGDGVVDVVVARPSQDGVYTFPSDLTGTVTQSDAASTFLPLTWSDSWTCLVGDQVWSESDLDGDGYDDLVVLMGCTDSRFSEMWVFRGPVASEISTSSAVATFRDTSWSSNVRLKVVPDSNSDALPEIFVGSTWGKNEAGDHVGAVRLHHSPFSGTIEADDAALSLFGTTDYCGVGTAVAEADMSGDGTRWYAVGHTESCVSGGVPRDVFGVFAPEAAWDGATMDDATAWLVTTQSSSGLEAWADVDGDGREDLLVHSYRSVRAPWDGGLYVVGNNPP